MKASKLASLIAVAGAAVALAAPAQADDYDYTFKQTVNRFGVYGPQDELAWLEGFREVIVRSLFEPIDPVLGFGHRGQQQHRDAPVRPQCAGQFQPTLARHHDVEHDEVEGEAREVRARLARIGGGSHPKAAVRQVATQQFP